jgi:hypothetical protein
MFVAERSIKHNVMASIKVTESSFTFVTHLVLVKRPVYSRKERAS